MLRLAQVITYCCKIKVMKIPDWFTGDPKKLKKTARALEGKQVKKKEAKPEIPDKKLGNELTTAAQRISRQYLDKEKDLEILFEIDEDNKNKEVLPDGLDQEIGIRTVNNLNLTEDVEDFYSELRSNTKFNDEYFTAVRKGLLTKEEAARQWAMRIFEKVTNKQKPTESFEAAALDRLIKTNLIWLDEIEDRTSSSPHADTIESKQTQNQVMNEKIEPKGRSENYPAKSVSFFPGKKALEEAEIKSPFDFVNFSRKLGYFKPEELERLIKEIDEQLENFAIQQEGNLNTHKQLKFYRESAAIYLKYRKKFDEAKDVIEDVQELKNRYKRASSKQLEDEIGFKLRNLNDADFEEQRKVKIAAEITVLAEMITEKDKKVDQIKNELKNRGIENGSKVRITKGKKRGIVGILKRISSRGNLEIKVGNESLWLFSNQITNNDHDSVKKPEKEQSVRSTDYLEIDNFKIWMSNFNSVESEYIQDFVQSLNPKERGWFLDRPYQLLFKRLRSSENKKEIETLVSILTKSGIDPYHEQYGLRGKLDTNINRQSSGDIETEYVYQGSKWKFQRFKRSEDGEAQFAVVRRQNKKGEWQKSVRVPIEEFEKIMKEITSDLSGKNTAKQREEETMSRKAISKEKQEGQFSVGELEQRLKQVVDLIVEQDILEESQIDEVQKMLKSRDRLKQKGATEILRAISMRLEAAETGRGFLSRDEAMNLLGKI